MIMKTLSRRYAALSHLVAMTVLFAKMLLLINYCSSSLSRKHQKMSTTLTQILLRRNPPWRPSMTLWSPLSTRRSSVTSPSLRLNCWRAKSPSNWSTSHPVLVSLLSVSNTVPSGMYSMTPIHSPETRWGESQRGQPSTCSTATGDAPDELLRTL